MIPLRDLNPTRRVPVATLVLIAINVVVFVYQSTLGPRATDRFILQFGMTPAQVVGDVNTFGYTLFTSMFLHGDVLHIGSNMLYLWIFGNNIEDRLGILRFLIFYFVSGLLASGTQIAVDPTSTVPNIGASGAIAGVLGAYIVLFPNARVQTLLFLWYLVRVVEVSAVWLLGWWFVLQVFSGLLDAGTFQAQGGVAYFAHIGGFVAGWLLIRVFTAGRPSTVTDDAARIPTADDIFKRGRRNDRWWD